MILRLQRFQRKSLNVSISYLTPYWTSQQIVFSEDIWLQDYQTHQKITLQSSVEPLFQIVRQKSESSSLRKEISHIMSKRPRKVPLRRMGASSRSSSDRAWVCHPLSYFERREEIEERYHDAQSWMRDLTIRRADSRPQVSDTTVLQMFFDRVSCSVYWIDSSFIRNVSHYCPVWECKLAVWMYPQFDRSPNSKRKHRVLDVKRFMKKDVCQRETLWRISRQ